MTDTFIHIKGIKNDCCRDDEEPSYWSHKFFARHETNDQLKNAINQSLDDIFKMGGMIVVKNELGRGADYNNLFFVPMHMIARIEFEIKTGTGALYIDDVQGATKQ